MITDRNEIFTSNGICGGRYIADDACDCAGNVLDCMGICGGTAVIDCNGICGGRAKLDECGVCNGKGRVRCWDGSYVCGDEKCSADPHRATRRSSAAVSSHPGNPESLRYWKNIIPDYYTQYDRLGIGSLTDIEETFEDDTIDILFGFGNIGYDGINIDDTLYNYVELWTSWLDEIDEIKFKLNGIELPDITNSIDPDFGGIVGDDGQTKVTIIDNEVNIVGVGTAAIGGTYTVINKLLIKIPFISKSFNVCFEYLSIGSKIYVRSDGDEYTTFEQFPYWNFESQGPFMKNCQDPFTGIFIYEEYTQEWLGYCENSEYDNKVDCEFDWDGDDILDAKWITPYYPVLPKYNKFGKFDEELGLQNNNIPFGNIQREWNEDDPLALATLTVLPKAWSNNCLIDIDFSAIEDGVLNDVGPVTNLGILMDDYKVNFDSETNKPFAKKASTKNKLSKNNKDKLF